MDAFMHVCIYTCMYAYVTVGLCNMYVSMNACADQCVLCTNALTYRLLRWVPSSLLFLIFFLLNPPCTPSRPPLPCPPSIILLLLVHLHPSPSFSPSVFILYRPPLISPPSSPPRFFFKDRADINLTSNYRSLIIVTNSPQPQTRRQALWTPNAQAAQPNNRPSNATSAAPTYSVTFAFL